MCVVKMLGGHRYLNLIDVCLVLDFHSDNISIHASSDHNSAISNPEIYRHMYIYIFIYAILM